MIKLKSQFLMLFLIIILFLSSCDNNSRETESVRIGYELKLTGTIVGFQMDSYRDGLDVVQVQSDSKTYDVIFHYGEWPKCNNIDVWSQIASIKEGSEVEVFGNLTSRDIISVCDSLEYYVIKK